MTSVRLSFWLLLVGSFAALGYASYGTPGSDGGAMVSRELAVMDPEGFLGAHVLQLFSFPSGDPAEMADLLSDELDSLDRVPVFEGAVRAAVT